MANDHECWFPTRAATHRAGAQLTRVASSYKLKSRLFYMVLF